MDRPQRFDRDYLLSRIELGHEIVIPTIGVVSKAEHVPSQEKLDEIRNGGAKPSPSKSTPSQPASQPGGPLAEIFCGRPLAEYVGKTDAQIDKLKGVKTEDVANIRAALTAAGK
jgi:hypothetical protein